MRRRVPVLVLLAIALAGCGGGGSGTPKLPPIVAARTYKLVGFTPSGPVAAGKPVKVSFVIQQPDGAPLTAYKHGSGPHNGVHLIMVRRDLDTIIHRHPPIGAGGRASVTVVFPEPGPYRVVIDAYPKTSGTLPNFQLFTTIHVAGKYVPQALPPYGSTDRVDGYTFTVHGTPHLKAIQASDIDVTVTDPNGKPAQFEPWVIDVLPHAHLRAKRDRVRECAWGSEDHRNVGDAGPSERRRTRPCAGDVASLPPVPGERPDLDRAVHAGRPLIAKRETTLKKVIALIAVSGLATLVLAGTASAHARMSPAVSIANELQLYSLAIPTEKENATTTKIVLNLPQGFSIDSFAPSPGWKRVVQQTGTGDSAVVQKVTWTGGNTPTEEDSLFQFLAQPAKSGTYTFDVEQTYSDGSIVDWSGPESAAAPAPTIDVRSSFGGSGTSMLTIVALVLGALGILFGGFALLSKSGRQLA